MIANMARTFALVCALFALAALLVAAPRAADAITCGGVASALSPCVNYIRGRGQLSDGCCNGVRSLNAAAGTAAARQATCNCLKSYARRIPGINYGNAAGIPKACHVNVGYPISPSVDCSKVR